MNTCEYLARVGFESLLVESTPAGNEDDPASVAAAKMADHQRVRRLLLSREPKPITGKDGVYWLTPITWPDRVPGLKTWAGNQSLAKIIAKAQKAIDSVDTCEDLFDFRAMLVGSTGFDSLACPRSIDVGFSLAATMTPVEQRPALELLAIIGLETLPLVSLAARDCGFVHDGHVWRFEVQNRDGYYKMWGPLCECQVAT